MITYCVEEITNPLSDDQWHDYRKTKRDISGTLNEDDSQTDGHAYCATQLARSPDQCIFTDVTTL